ncbi:MAG: Mu-like prophage major head subunit gpT family protein [Phycisphaeraceae bacterium]|nr:Mu-like prophage major head subunit gpT family protein [Phycisphaeraceae bacterium]
MTPTTHALQLLTLRAAADVAVDVGQEKKLPRVTIQAYGGGPMTIPAWGVVVVDLAGMEIPEQIALLVDHENILTKVAGHGRARVVKGRLVVEGELSGSSEVVEQIVNLARNGMQLQASIGAQPLETRTIEPGEKIKVNGRTQTLPRGGVLIVRSRLRETSIVALGADDETSVRIAAKRETSYGETNMGKEVQTIDEQAILSRERQRVAEIDRLCACAARSGVASDAVEKARAEAIEGKLDMAQLSAKFLDAARSRLEAIPLIPRHQTVSAAAALEGALLCRLGRSDLAEKSLGADVMEQSARIRGSSLLDICAMALALDGQSVPHNDKKGLVRASMSTASLPIALGGALEKILITGFNAAAPSWKGFAAIRSVSNFREHQAVRPSASGRLEQVAPGGELKHAALTEWTTPLKAETYGKIVRVDRQMLINDDIGVLDEVAFQLGRMAQRTLTDTLYRGLLAAAATHFTTAQSNYIEGSTTALSLDALSTGLASMRRQRDSDGREIDVVPAVLLVPPSLEATGRALLTSAFTEDPSATSPRPTGNPVAGAALSLAVEPRLENSLIAGYSSTAWYLFAGPADSPWLVGYLNGQENPTIEYHGLDSSTDTLGMTWRVYHDFAVAAGDPKAGFKSKGAA